MIWACAGWPSSKRFKQGSVGGRSDGMKIEDALKIALLGILILSTASSLFVAIVNPEAIFFGQKLGGAMADAYLLANGFFGVVVAIAVLRWEDNLRYLPIAFFGYNFVEILFTNIYIFDKAVVSPLHSLGLTISVLLVVVERYRVVRSTSRLS